MQRKIWCLFQFYVLWIPFLLLSNLKNQFSCSRSIVVIDWDWKSETKTQAKWNQKKNCEFKCWSCCHFCFGSRKHAKKTWSDNTCLFFLCVFFLFSPFFHYSFVWVRQDSRIRYICTEKTIKVFYKNACMFVDCGVESRRLFFLYFISVCSILWDKIGSSA